jgi:hypothetical protein
VPTDVVLRVEVKSDAIRGWRAVIPTTALARQLRFVHNSDFLAVLDLSGTMRIEDTMGYMSVSTEQMRKFGHDEGCVPVQSSSMGRY